MKRVVLDRVSKQFALPQQRSRSFQELFLGLRKLKLRRTKDAFWVLRDVSLEVAPGEMIGVVGPNGAGKSTILKLISGIIAPTSGEINVSGRVGALLELGAGFHPELTGRENIFLNGAILGFDRAEIQRLYPDIVRFAELTRFIDMPVKHYSTGMYMRLGFSIAIHVQPDIMLVDEVLAVGDTSFQYRCLDAIHKMKRRGVSILLVTHSLEFVRTMCDRAVWLDRGKILRDGPVALVLEEYMAWVRRRDEQALLAEGLPDQTGDGQLTQDRGDVATVSNEGPEATRRWGSREAEIVEVQILDAQEHEQRIFATGDELVVRIHYSAKQRLEKPQFGLALHHTSGFHINGPNTVLAGRDIEAIEGNGFIDYVVESLPLLEGTYLLSVSLYDHDGEHAYDHHHQAYRFRVRPTESIGEKYGSVYMPSRWILNPADEGD